MSRTRPLLIIAAPAAGLLAAIGVFGPLVSTVLLVGCVGLACAPRSPVVSVMLRLFGAEPRP